MTRSTEQLKRDEALKEATHGHMLSAIKAMVEADIQPASAFMQIISWAVMNLKANMELNDLQMAILLSECLQDANTTLQDDNYDIEEANFSK